MSSSRALIATAAVVVCGAAAGPAAAEPPSGDWTFLRSDPYRHYACKFKQKGGDWGVRTATRGRKDGIENGIGVYAVIARGSNDNLVRTKTSEDWDGGWIRLAFRGLDESDRLWIQSAAYGPVEPWSDGDRVGRLKRCADVR